MLTKLKTVDPPPAPKPVRTAARARLAKVIAQRKTITDNITRLEKRLEAVGKDLIEASCGLRDYDDDDSVPTHSPHIVSVAGMEFDVAAEETADQKKASLDRATNKYDLSRLQEANRRSADLRRDLDNEKARLEEFDTWLRGSDILLEVVKESDLYRRAEIDLSLATATMHECRERLDIDNSFWASFRRRLCEDPDATPEG